MYKGSGKFVSSIFFSFNCMRSLVKPVYWKWYSTILTLAMVVNKEVVPPFHLVSDITSYTWLQHWHKTAAIHLLRGLLATEGNNGRRYVHVQRNLVQRHVLRNTRSAYHQRNADVVFVRLSLVPGYAELAQLESMIAGGAKQTEQDAGQLMLALLVGVSLLEMGNACAFYEHFCVSNRHVFLYATKYSMTCPSAA